MVFQSYALWPHMTVRKNIAYPLRATQDQGRAGERMGRGGRRARRHGQPARPLSRRSSAAASSSGSRSRAASSPAPTSSSSTSRSATSTPGCAIGAHRDPRAPHPARVHRRLRHPRPVRGARPRRPARDHAGRARSSSSARRSEIFEEPATEYVADFIGMSNRLGLRAARRRWTFEGEPLEGDLGWSQTASTDGRRPHPARGHRARTRNDGRSPARWPSRDRRRLRVRRPASRRRRQDRGSPAARPDPRRRARGLGPEPAAPTAGRRDATARATSPSTTIRRAVSLFGRRVGRRELT